ncbi:hypothetical protein [Streptosporangium carneum]|uniref:Uncharacterized protein n=1 Tax=Streptosporangium carneum TaxID=47481 RepID=A0A9W6I164_9ACTN|nr:hypothetical protein [Streptosporangium carneum]GLK10096.1 hypothetical protein GCM10017600_35020 [Streptosporangium carneum]
MERHTGSDQSSDRHDPSLDAPHPWDTSLELAFEDTRALFGELPRMFALVQGCDDEEVATEVVAYGLALPGGAATTVGANGHGFGLWRSPHSAAWRLRSDLVWLGEDAARPDGVEGPLS